MKVFVWPYVCNVGSETNKKKKKPHIRITMTAFLAQDLSWNIYSRQVGNISAVMEPEF